MRLTKAIKEKIDSYFDSITPENLLSKLVFKYCFKLGDCKGYEMLNSPYTGKPMELKREVLRYTKKGIPFFTYQEYYYCVDTDSKLSTTKQDTELFKRMGIDELSKSQDFKDIRINE